MELDLISRGNLELVRLPPAVIPFSSASSSSLKPLWKLCDYQTKWTKALLFC